MATAAAILLVGLVYSIALRHTWVPQGWQAVADHALHDAAPPLFLIAWFLFPHRLLAWRDVAGALIPPTAFLVYSFARGAADGWYPYHFLNPELLGPKALAVNVAALSAGFVAAALLLIIADRGLGRRSQPTASVRE
jgi:hypothetical protein